MQWCSDESYRRDLYERRYDPHVEPINRFVDELRKAHTGKFIPHVAPTYGGVNARLLALFQDPGPKTNPRNPNGSGMLCVENDDESAERHKMFLRKYGIDVSDTLSWNSWPWFQPSKYPTHADRQAAVEALATVLAMQPKIRVVMLHGRVARRMWKFLCEVDPRWTEGVRPINSWHTSKRVVDPETKSVAEIERFTRELHESFREAANHLREPSQLYVNPWATGVADATRRDRPTA